MEWMFFSHKHLHRHQLLLLLLDLFHSSCTSSDALNCFWDQALPWALTMHNFCSLPPTPHPRPPTLHPLSLTYLYPHLNKDSFVSLPIDKLWKIVYSKTKTCLPSLLCSLWPLWTITPEAQSLALACEVDNPAKKKILKPCQPSNAANCDVAADTELGSGWFCLFIYLCIYFSDWERFWGLSHFGWKTCA